MHVLFSFSNIFLTRTVRETFMVRYRHYQILFSIKMIFKVTKPCICWSYSDLLTTDKIEKEDSSHATTVKFIGQKQLVQNFPIILLKITIFVNMWHLGQFLKNRNFPNICLMEVRIWEFFCTYVTHMTVKIFHTLNCIFLKSIFSYIYISLPNVACFSAISPSINRSISQENAFKKRKHLLAFHRKPMAGISLLL